jgi:catechol 2,3-dioxygenase-like lactoylglutathione lyase family enzyme
MPRDIDHIVHAVRDLDAAADLYRRLGFTVGSRNRHPWGTHNRVVQLASGFIELLAVAEPERLGGEGFARLFGEFNRSFLERREGLSFLILGSGDAVRDAADLHAANIAASDALHFEREGSRADASKVQLGFSLVFAREEKAPAIGFALCQQHWPENFWDPAFQHHANTASAITGAVIVAENPTDHHIFLSAFTGVRELHAASGAVIAPTPRGDVKILDPAAFHTRFGVMPPDVAAGAQLAAIELRVSDRDAVAGVLAVGGIDYAFHMGAVVVAPEAAMGATLIFEAPSAAISR